MNSSEKASFIGTVDSGKVLCEGRERERRSDNMCDNIMDEGNFCFSIPQLAIIKAICTHIPTLAQKQKRSKIESFIIKHFFFNKKNFTFLNIFQT
jgi:hypothetical protein